MTAAIGTPLEGKLGPIVADAGGTITVQEASDVLDCSRFRVCELLSPRVGRVVVVDVLAVEIVDAGQRARSRPCRQFCRLTRARGGRA